MNDDLSRKGFLPDPTDVPFLPGEAEADWNSRDLDPDDGIGGRRKVWILQDYPTHPISEEAQERLDKRFTLGGNGGWEDITNRVVEELRKGLPEEVPESLRNAEPVDE